MAHRMRLKLAALLAGAVAIGGATAAAAQPPIVQPGAPGQSSRGLSATEASRIAGTRHSPADVAFMQGMIHHHQQAMEMVVLVPERTNTPDIVAMADRIRASQGDEIQFMQSWLRARGEMAPAVGTVPAAAGHAGHGAQAGHGAHAGHDMAGMDHSTMQGMATPEQMAALAAARGTEFDRLFLQRMIAHHEGALAMVRELLASPGSAYDPALFEFTSDVKNEQQSEIDRMNVILAGLSPDPRAQLAAGLTNPGVAAKNMRLVASLPKPAGFFDPENPGGLAPPIPAEPTTEDASRRGENDGQQGTQFGERSSLLSFWNTDIAFSNDLMVTGNYHGFNVYRLGAEGRPALISSVVCPGGQGDISIAGNILIMSVEQTRGRVDCGLQGVEGEASADRFRGLRIFDISNPAEPRQVGQVQTCRGSHTHSIVSSDARRIVVYNSGTAEVRDEAELAGCIGDVPGDSRTALFSIDVIEIPVANPAAARIVDRPRVFADQGTGQIAGLWRGGDHGEGTQNTNRTDQCHDITVFPSRNIAAGACSGNGILLDISDPLRPKRIDAVSDPGFAYWHSATFNNDGTKVIFTDEWGGGARPRCRTYDPANYGADAIYDIVENRLVRRGTFKLPAPQGDKENCVAHNGSIVPVPGRDIFVQAWYQGGISVIDFTDSNAPREIAYFDRGPIDAEQLVLGGFWSAYWYDGHIYGTEITRGLDVLALTPSEWLTEAELAAAAAARYPGNVFNPQTQQPVTWPAGVAARAEASRGRSASR
ncbi:uncharacterized protein (DUF305 family) [Sphingomonas jejuensis]|uniref:Uncharacterized protein (DUF305 family) n=1 Tax=Sphingomonas jejuensis TaxID=904715 RepID=A0ABX0XPB0_9SPHN|nr:DUF305 domain-containing protein [Sphingomonas jejuensis]NJC35219.1 uncharacterized protein (DUF305 family) [Sphingomonas jejuensis]